MKLTFAFIVTGLLVASTAFASNMTVTGRLHATSAQMHPTQTAPDNDRDGGCARDNTGNLVDPTCKPRHEVINVAPTYTDKYGCRRNAKDGTPVDDKVDACHGNHVVQTPKTYTDKNGCVRDSQTANPVDNTDKNCHPGHQEVQTPATYRDRYGCLRDSQTANPVDSTQKNCHGHTDISPMHGILQRNHGSLDLQKP